METSQSEENVIRLSIRSFAEFLLRNGSIDARFKGLERGLEGARIHRMLQKQGGPGYKAEVPLSISLKDGGFHYQLSGRADGVIEQKDGLTVDEIKTLATPLELLGEDSHPEHWAQGCLYAHILCSQRKLAEVTVQLTYFNTETAEVRRFSRPYTAAKLSRFVKALLKQYHRWAQLSLSWKEERNASLKALTFPFDDYRDGQRQMAIACYNTFSQNGRLYCCAPTGIGKTLSSLFPALKALGEGYGEHIFYLTAKTIARKSAEDALALLRSRTPLAFRSLTLTAKDKICFLEQRACLPESCQYANGYYDRINDAVYDILQQGGDYSREAVEAAARRYSLCPYELSLDLALWCDCVIGDYNYLFDPVVHLQRFFDGPGGDYLFLVDEAHNLIDRSREMYSAQLCKEDFFAFKKLLPKTHTRLHRALNAINSAFVGLRRQCEEESLPTLTLPRQPSEMEKPLQQFCAATEAFLEDHRGSQWEEALLSLYFSALFYQRISEGYDDTYITLVYHQRSNVTLRLFCLDPSAFLDKSLSLGRAAVLFSATLQPLPYYRETLGGGEGAKLLLLGSPFKKEHLGLYLADGVSTKYADRQASLSTVAHLLAAMVGAKKGNYIAYFPSYAYLKQVLAVFTELYPDVETIVQASGMDEAAREDFLAAFMGDAGTTLLGFCVLGGIFAEGVDLPGHFLIGTAVVGVGLPGIGPECDAVRRYYDDKNGCGFEYAYQFPGMNKVLQAAGRVIRTSSDRGVVLLIDSRFSSSRYQSLFPDFWNHWQRTSQQTLPAQLEGFWAAPSL